MRVASIAVVAVVVGIVGFIIVAALSISRAGPNLDAFSRVPTQQWQPNTAQWCGLFHYKPTVESFIGQDLLLFTLTWRAPTAQIRQDMIKIDTEGHGATREIARVDAAVPSLCGVK
jgi:hypothetical protein